MDALTIVLLTIAAVGLVLTLLSLVGLDFGAVDVEIGDSGIGLLSLLLPMVTMGCGVSGLMLSSGAALALAIPVGGAGALLTAVLLLPLLRLLMRSGRESAPTEFIGRRATVIEPAEHRRAGLAEVITENGSTTVPIYLDPDCSEKELRPGSICYLTSKPSEQALPWYVTTFGQDQQS